MTRIALGHQRSDICICSDAFAIFFKTMAAILTSVGFFFIQDKKDGRIIWFNLKGYKNKVQRLINYSRGTTSDEEAVHAKVLIDAREAMASFLIGMEKIFGVLIILTLAWATGAIMNAVGLSELLRSVSVPAICHIVTETN